MGVPAPYENGVGGLPDDDMRREQDREQWARGAHAPRALKDWGANPADTATTLGELMDWHLLYGVCPCGHANYIDQRRYGGDLARWQRWVSCKVASNVGEIQCTRI